MSGASRSVVICGNWKMYKTIQEAVEFIKTLAPLLQESQVQERVKVYLAVPFTAIQAAAQATCGTPIVVGAQNMNEASEGAFTGEIAAKMLKDAGAQFVVLGHSERRQYFKESDEQINKKVKRALQDGLQPILCIGETLQEREAGKTEEVLYKQLEGGLNDISEEELKKVILAYEPVWAIGTGKTATPEMAEETHQACRKWVAQHWSQESADQVSILYGGSVKADNIAELMAQPDIDGALVGGASLSAESFNQIIHFG